jgi:hypothetical protein
MTFKSSVDGLARAAAAGDVRSRAWPRAFLALLLLCLLVQATAVQSHLHFLRPVSAPAAVAGNHSTLSRPGQSDPAADCPLCQEAAMAGAYVLPPVPALPPPPPQVLWLASASLTPFALLTPARGWLSRAPPE